MHPLHEEFARALARDRYEDTHRWRRADRPPPAVPLPRPRTRAVLRRVRAALAR